MDTGTTAAEPIGRISGIPLYANGCAPDYLLTKAGLAEQGLRPGPGQQPAAYIRVRYYKTLAALYHPAFTVQIPPRSLGQNWAYRQARTCPKCHVEQRYVVDVECGDCRTAAQKKRARLYTRTCRACGKVGQHPFAKDREFPGWHRCPPCRVIRKAELDEAFEVGLAKSQACPDCGTRVQSKAAALARHKANPHYWARIVCGPCEAVREEKRAEAQREAAKAEHRREQARRDQVTALEEWAREMLADPDTVILDTETTGLHDAARIVDIAVTTATGETVLNTLLNPGAPIPAEATAIHGITDDMVANAPSFGDILPALREALHGKRVLIYNDVYDLERLGHELNVHHHGTGELLAVGKKWLTIHDAKAEDAMQPYSTWYGEWSEWHGNYRWQRLGGGHRAHGDCLAVIDVLKAMAKGSSSDEEDEWGW